MATLYLAAAKIGFRAAFVAEQVSPVWPPTGIALWALLYLDIRMWPAIWVGALIANATTHVPVLAASAIATGNTLEAVLGYWLLRRFANVEHSLERLRHVTGLIMGAAVVSTVSATVGVTTLCLSGLQPWDRFQILWWIWWLGDATGASLVAPVLLTAPIVWRAARGTDRLHEGLVLGSVTIALSALVFIEASPMPGPRPLQFVVYPLIIWAGLRFAHPGAALVNAVISTLAVWGTLHGTGPFSSSEMPAQDRVILLQIYTAVMATSGLVLGGAIADRNRSERMRQVDHTLTAILANADDLKDAAGRVLRAVCETLEWDVGMFWRVNEDQGILKFVDGWRREPRFDEFIAASRDRRFEPGIGLPGRVWASAKPAWIDDVVVDANFPRFAVAARLGLHGGFAFPILLRDQVVGVVEFFVTERRGVDPSLVALMTAAGAQIGQFVDRRRAGKRALESRALNSAIVDAALDGVISIDGRGLIVEFNPAASDMFGIARDNALGRELAQAIVPERLRERHREALRRSVETSEARILARRMEMPALRADGTEFPVELSITRVASGERPVFTAHVRDITDRKRIEQERVELLTRERDARVQAENANRSKDQFLATVSHELRTPLTAILGWASMLRTRTFDAERTAQIYDSVYRNAQMQAQIVNDLLDVSRIVTGQLRLDLQPIDVCEVARLSLETIRPAAAAKGVRLESDVPKSECLASGDPARLQQVIWNLLSNATKFTPAGGAVTLSVLHSPSSVTIRVEDTGVGIAPGLLPRVFERFWQADSTTTRAHGGLGLGLALVRHIVELHGGDVQAFSAGEGRGSTFTVSLPAVRARGVQVPEPGLADAQEPAPDLRGVTALVVDDDAAARELFATILVGCGARVLCAASASEAFRIATRSPTDIIVIDIGMPGEDGLSLLKRIRADEDARAIPRTPAIAVTAYAGPVHRDASLGAGFSAHLSKPVLPHEFLTAVARSLQRATS